MIRTIVADGTTEVNLLKEMRGRAGEIDAKVTRAVMEILEQVRLEGDAAVLRYTRQFDGVSLDALEVPRAAVRAAYEHSDEKFVQAMLRAKENIAAFHQRQKQQGFIDMQPSGVLLGQRVRGLHRVGLYVPGGTAAYPSSVLMNAIPAKIAGVGEIVMVTPPGRDGKPTPAILTAAWIAGVDRVFLAGGAQGVAALAYATESVPRVDKIVGPGNIYVATAKKLVYGTVDIDMIAGPSEILILADDTADPRFIAADLMSQAEHDALASAVLVTTSAALAMRVGEELARQTASMPRREIIEQSLADYGAIIICKTLDQAVSMANALAPEHLEVVCADGMQLLGRLDNAGSIFVGSYSPEPLGDYYAGPNHVLPTSGTARFFSPLSVDDFVKKTSFISYTQQALCRAREDIVTIAEREGLYAHANAVKVRFS